MSEEKVNCNNCMVAYFKDALCSKDFCEKVKAKGNEDDFIKLLSKSIDISKEDLGTLCICALRYCHGRRTYMPSLVQSIVARHLNELSDKDIKIMVDDCQFQQDMNLYGDDCDKVDWLKWREKVETEWSTRKEQNK